MAKQPFPAETDSLISLNDLPDEPHNAFVKLFATKKGQRLSAIKRFRKAGKNLPDELRSHVGKFLEILALVKGDTDMKNTEFELTPEERKEMALFVTTELTPEEILECFAPEQRLAGLTLEQIFEKFDPEEIEAYLKKRRKKALSC